MSFIEYEKSGLRTFKGSVAWMAPETINQNKYTRKTDIWSLGCVFAEALFGKHAFFYGKDNEDQLFQIIKVLGVADLKAYLEKYRINKNEVVSKLGK